MQSHDHGAAQTTLVDAALSYGGRGIPVFPCNPATKAPLIANGFKHASTDDATIRAWWQAHPDAMIGMPTGSPSGVWVLDVDAPEIFESSCPVELPETRKAETGKGYHLYFTHEDNCPVRNRQRHPKKPWPFDDMPGAETRGEGGYVILPPSKHPSGKLYQWAREGDVAKAPDALIRIVCAAKPDKATDQPSAPHIGDDTPYGLAALASECCAIRSAVNGEQESALNEAALKIGALCAGGALSLQTARSQLIAAGLAMGSHDSRHPWTPQMVLDKVERALTDGSRSPRSAPERSDRSKPAEYGFIDNDGVWTAYGDDWTAPDFATEPEPPQPVPSLDLCALAATRAKAKEYAIERIAPEGEVTTLNGPGSSGKSLLGQQLATAAAAGLACLRLSVAAGPALYLTCEDDAEQLHWRQEHLCAAMGIEMATLAGKLHLASLRGQLGNELATFAPDGKMTVTPAYQRLVATFRATGAKIAFLDNVAHLYTGNENDRSQVTRFVNLLNRLAGETGAAIILLGHPNKAGDEWSGSTAWNNAVRSRLWLDHNEDTDMRTLSLPKSNYSRKGDVLRFVWQDWAFVHEDDLPADVARDLAETIMASADNKLFLACLAVRNQQRRQVSEKPTAQNYAPKVFADMPESKGIGKLRLQKALDRLYRNSAIERGFLYRNSTEGKDVEGLREVTSGEPQTSGNLSDNLPETPSGNLR